MSSNRFRVLLILIVTILSGCGTQGSENRSTESSLLKDPVNEQNYSQSEYIVVLKVDVNIETALKELSKFNPKVKRDMNKGRFLISLTNDPGIKQLRKQLEDSKYIGYIQPNYRYKAQ